MYLLNLSVKFETDTTWIYFEFYFINYNELAKIAQGAIVVNNFVGRIFEWNKYFITVGDEIFVSMFMYKFVRSFGNQLQNVTKFSFKDTQL